MKRCLVHLKNNGKSFYINAGTALLECLWNSGLPINALCGGNGICGKCRVRVNGEEVLACQTTVMRDMTVELPEQEENIILTGSAGNMAILDQTDSYVAAFDIGTTTAVCYLLDGHSGEELAVVSCLNPQCIYGADVISRIQYVLKNKGNTMQQLMTEALGKLMTEAADKSGIKSSQITMASLVGNTCMHHLFLGIDPESLTKIPYMPKVTEALEVHGTDYLPMAEEGALRVLPNIAGFVGADTAGCMIAVEFDRTEEWTLLLDIGTNGEMVLGKGERRIACSTAAGPAFEGAKIACGMRGAYGAIDHVSLENGKLNCSVIGGGKAAGLCGSGLLDAVAVFLEMGLLTSAGRMKKEERFREYYLEREFGKVVRLSGDIYLTQKDIREVQLAKAAI